MKRLIPDELGESLFGRRWQTALAGELGVHVRTMQRWAAGSRPTADRAKLLELIDARLDRLRRLRDAVGAWTGEDA